LRPRAHTAATIRPGPRRPSIHRCASSGTVRPGESGGSPRVHRQRTTRPHPGTTGTADAAWSEGRLTPWSPPATGYQRAMISGRAHPSRYWGARPRNPAAHPPGLGQEAVGRHSSALGRHLDSYLAGVARELQAGAVLTGSPQRTNLSHRLVGSIVLDCTALRLAAWTPDQQKPPDRRSLGGALHPERPAPVLASWDEDAGWCVGLHRDPTHSSRRHLHPDLLPAAQTVVDFVVGLALGQPLGADRPLTAPAPGRPQLRLVP
jgi:hypothetical protein